MPVRRTYKTARIRQNGLGIFSSIGKALRGVARFAKKHKVISRGANLAGELGFSNPYIKTAGSLAGRAGYGKRRVRRKRKKQTKAQINAKARARYRKKHGPRKKKKKALPYCRKRAPCRRRKKGTGLSRAGGGLRRAGGGLRRAGGRRRQSVFP
jgi:hypothetical protein